MLNINDQWIEKRHNQRQMFTQTQVELLAQLAVNNKYAIFLPQGCGKTRPMLQHIENLKSKNKNLAFLILCPVVCIKNVWQREIEKWGFDFTTHIYHNRGMKNAPKGKDIYIASNDLVRMKSSDKTKFQMLLFELKRLGITGVIIDESSKYRNISSNRTRVLMRLLQPNKGAYPDYNPSARFEHIYILSGTPQPNKLENLWSQTFLIDGGKRLGTRVTHFRNTYTPFYNEHTHTYFERPGAQKEAWEKINDIAYSKSPKYKEKSARIIPLYFDLTKKELSAYLEFIKTGFLQADKFLLIADSTGSRVSRSMQLSGGTVVDHDKHIQIFSSEKLKRALDFIEQQESEPVLVGYQFTAEAQRLYAELKKRGVKIEWIYGKTSDNKIVQIIDDWNAGKLEVLIGQPARMGHGLNMQFGGSTILWFSPPNMGDFELYDQFNARLDRPGQTKELRIFNLIANNTFDEKAFDSITRKGNINSDFLEFVEGL